MTSRRRGEALMTIAPPWKAWLTTRRRWRKPEAAAPLPRAPSRRRRRQSRRTRQSATRRRTYRTSSSITWRWSRNRRTLPDATELLLPALRWVDTCFSQKDCSSFLLFFFFVSITWESHPLASWAFFSNNTNEILFKNNELFCVSKVTYCLLRISI